MISILNIIRDTENLFNENIAIKEKKIKRTDIIILNAHI